jgi:hypothetical protein
MTRAAGLLGALLFSLAAWALILAIAVFVLPGPW